MTETKIPQQPHALMELMEDAGCAIDSNQLLPPQEKTQLVDALERACEAAGRSYGDTYEARCAYTSEICASFGERITKIATCADELFTDMKGDTLSAARDGDWEPLRAELVRQQAQFDRGYALIAKDVFDFLLEVFDGKRRPKRRPTSVRIAARNRAIIWFVITERERGVGDDQSIENAVKKFNLGKRSIYGIASSSALDSERQILARVRALQQDVDDLTAKLTVYHETKCALPFAK
jgi:hypothetical protein